MDDIMTADTFCEGRGLVTSLVRDEQNMYGERALTPGAMAGHRCGPGHGLTPRPAVSEFDGGRTVETPGGGGLEYC